MMAYAKPNKPREPKAAQSKQIWRAKSTASPREALCEVEAQPHLSREDKGKTPLSVDGAAYAASTRGAQRPLNCETKFGAQCRVRHKASLALFNQRTLVSSARFAPLSEVRAVTSSADSVAYAASTLKNTSKVPGCKARTKVLCSANHLRRNVKIKAPLCVKSEATPASLPMLSSAKLALGDGAKRLASSSEANVTGIVLTSPVIKERSFNARVLQLEQPST